MADLDQISAAIGKLQGAQEAQIRHNAAVWIELHNINDKLSCLPNLVDRVGDIEPQIEDFKRLKHWGLGLIAGLSFVSALAAANLKFISRTIRVWFQ